MTIWSLFPPPPWYFNPSESTFMINYIVDDLEAFLPKVHEPTESASTPSARDHDYGRFAWIYDPDDNKIELW